jgi:hypothetical protein
VDLYVDTNVSETHASSVFWAGIYLHGDKTQNNIDKLEIDCLAKFDFEKHMD